MSASTLAPGVRHCRWRRQNLGGLIARDLAACGAKAIAIHFNSASTKADADATIAAVKAAGAQAVAFQADLTTAGATEKLFADAIAAIGKPDIAINIVEGCSRSPSSRSLKPSTTR